MKNSVYSNGFFLEAHTIAIRTPTKIDIASGEWSGWYNSYEVTKYNGHGIFPVSIDDEVRYIEEKMSRKDSLVFSVIEKKTGDLIGNAALQNIDLINRKSNIAITIGKPIGISTAIEVYGLLLEHAFSRMNINRVGDATHARLESLVKMLSVLGFKEEGRFREYFLRDCVYSDAICFGILLKDFVELKKMRNGCILFDKAEELNRALVSAVKAPYKV
jgi:RimJ/RimL family protein N-acetyltransferase